MNQNLSSTEKFPYSKLDYVKRVIWFLLKNTLWKIGWHRIPQLRMVLLRLMGASVHSKSLVFGSVDIIRPWDLEIGRFVAVGPRVSIYNLGLISIGDNTVISQDVYLCGGTHDYTDSLLPLQRKSILVGSNVWICAGAFIGPGVRIGDGAVVGARSVVLKDVAAWTVVAGNPAKFIKKREINN